MIVSNGSSGWGPFEEETFWAQPVPAQQTAIRSGPAAPAAADGGLHRVLVADVAGDELQTQLAGQRAALVGVDVGDRDLRATLVQGAHGRLAEARGAPDDDRCAVLDHHEGGSL